MGVGGPAMVCIIHGRRPTCSNPVEAMLHGGQVGTTPFILHNITHIIVFSFA